MGVIHGIRSFVPRILASGGRATSSTRRPWRPSCPGRLGPYTVAKHGVLGLSDVLRAELASLAHPIGVSVVMPGMIKTGMNRSARWRPQRWRPTCWTPSGGKRNYVFTDDHSTGEVDERLNAILSARRDVVG